MSLSRHQRSSSPTPTPRRQGAKKRSSSDTDSGDSSSTETVRMTADAWARNFWITLLDEEGETFYANPATGERKWALPAGTLILPRSAEGEWYELWSDEHKLPYYFHTLTSETKWYRPDGFVIPLKAVQRFSKGKRFSLLSLDSAVFPPDAPEQDQSLRSADATSPHSVSFDIPASDSFEDLAKRSLELDVGDDPLAAALLQCMVASTFSTANTSRNGDGNRKGNKAMRREHSSNSNKSGNSGDASTVTTLEQFISDNDTQAFDTSLSSNSTLSSITSTPLQTPIMPSDGFGSPYSPAAVATASVHRGQIDSSLLLSPDNSAYAGICFEEHDEHLYDANEGTHSSACSPKTKIVSPLKVRKKRSKIGLGEAFEPVLPVPAGSRTTSTEAPATMRSPSSRFSSMFVSPKTPSSPRDTGGEDITATPKWPISPKNTWGRSASAKIGGMSVSPGTTSTPRSASFTQPVVASSSLSALPGHQAPKPLPSPLLADIKRFSFDAYAAQHFGQRRKTGLFRRQISLQDSMKWQSSDPEAPFLNLPKSLRWDALQCFTHLQHVMGDRVRSDSVVRVSLEDINAPSSWDASTTGEARRILSMGIESAPELRDEIFVQLICQLTENPSAISIYRGWQFMQVLLVTFPPSPSLEPALRQFILARKGSSPKSRLGIIARYALMKLDQIIVKGPRGKTPSHFEIKAASEGAFQPSVYGETLQRIMSLQSEAYPDAKIPIILPFLADGIMALGGLRTPGIFRSPADIDKVNELRIHIDQGRYSFAGYEDPNIAASLLKLWLRELLQPLIPIELYDDCMSSAQDQTKVIEIIQKLPSSNRRIVAFVISFLQTFIQDPVIKNTMMSAASLSMIFTPALFRPPPVGAGSISTVFNNARVEQQFLLQLLTHLDVSQLQDEDDWVPAHGKNISVSSSNFSSTASSDASTTESRPSLDSADTSLSMSTNSLASSKRKKRPRVRARTKTEALDTSQYGGDISSDGSSTDAATSPEKSRSRAVSDSYYLHGGKGIAVETDPLPPLPAFIRPLIIVDEAD